MHSDIDNVLIIPIEKKMEMELIPVDHLLEQRRSKTVTLDYLPWVEAKRLLEINFPTYRVRFENEQVHRIPFFNYAEVGFVVFPYIIDIATGKRTDAMYFPVMDYNHRTLKEPGATDINNAMQRAAVKCIALETWIGISVFRKLKEDVPPEEEVTPKFQPRTGVTEEEIASSPEEMQDSAPVSRSSKLLSKKKLT